MTDEAKPAKPKRQPYLPTPTELPDYPLNPSRPDMKIPEFPLWTVFHPIDAPPHTKRRGRRT
jgi:hypothetical protein